MIPFELGGVSADHLWNECMTEDLPKREMNQKHPEAVLWLAKLDAI